MNTIVKRDGRVVPFDPLKIRDAILKAMAETEAGEDIPLATMIAGQIAQVNGQMGVEDIQDLVEDKLMSSNRKDAARKYIIYRNERTKIRELDSDLMRKIKEKVTASNVENANANVDERSFGGRKAEAAAIIQKEIALDELMSKDIADAHRDGLIYQHDLDSYAIGMHNCLFCDIERLFTNGFITRNGDVRPPNSLSTACQQLAVILQAQSQVQYGGVAALHIDSDLAPFVKKSFVKYYLDGMKYIEHCTQNDIDTFCDWFKENDFSISDPWLNDDRPAVYTYAMDLLEREGRQSSQALCHNLNTLESRAGSQVGFGLGVW